MYFLDQVEELLPYQKAQVYFLSRALWIHEKNIPLYISQNATIMPTKCLIRAFHMPTPVAMQTAYIINCKDIIFTILRALGNATPSYADQALRRATNSTGDYPRR